MTWNLVFNVAAARTNVAENGAQTRCAQQLIADKDTYRWSTTL